MLCISTALFLYDVDGRSAKHRPLIRTDAPDGAITLPTNYFVYHQVLNSKILLSSHPEQLRIACGSQNKEQLLLYTALMDWFL